ncbi:MAG: hypothetical protein ACP5US_08360 [Candidatus Kryptoniota bacterium]
MSEHSRLTLDEMPLGARIALFIMIIGGILYLGGSAGRAIIGNDLVEVNTLQFRNDLSFDAEKEIYNLLAQTSLMVVASYFVTLFSLLFFLYKTKLNLRENPNALMAVILFALFIPVEIFTSYLDMKFFFAYVDLQFQLFIGADPGPIRDELRRLFVKRVSGIGGLSVIALLSYYSAIGALVIRPIREKRNFNEENNGENKN